MRGKDCAGRVPVGAHHDRQAKCAAKAMLFIPGVLAQIGIKVHCLSSTGGIFSAAEAISARTL